MKLSIQSLCALGFAIACGSSFAGGGDGAGGSSGSGSGSAGKASGGRGGSAGSSSGGSGNGTGNGGGVEPPIGSAGEGVIGSGGDGMIGSGGRPQGMGGEPVTGIGGAMVVTSCETLIEKYEIEVDKARDCNPDSPEPQCSPDWVMEVNCGCPVPISGFAENIDTIDNLLAEMQENGCALAVCDPACTQLVGLCGPLVGTADRFVCL